MRIWSVESRLADWPGESGERNPWEEAAEAHKAGTSGFREREVVGRAVLVAAEDQLQALELARSLLLLTDNHRIEIEPVSNATANVKAGVVGERPVEGRRIGRLMR